MRVGVSGLCRLMAAVVLAASAWGAPLAPMPVSGALAAETGANSDKIELASGAGELLRLPRPALSVFVAHPEVADVQVPSPNAIFLLGKKAGTTTLYAVDGNDREILRRSVVVRHNVAEMEDLLRQRFPAHRFVLASAPGSLQVTGAVDDAAQAGAVMDTLQPYLSKEDKLINSLSVRTPTQVHLRVRIAEVSREITQQFGVNWQMFLKPGNFVAGVLNGRDFYDDINKNWNIPSTGWGVNAGFRTKNYDINSVIDALDQEGLVSVMAEPTLTALSGQTASFLVGGEIPIPIVQGTNNSVSVTFKPFGVALDFTPTVLGSDRISLLVRPEISELSAAHSVTPVRRVETTVELASGQSFVIGGLLQDNMRDVVGRLPGLGNLPLLGKLFSSQNYRNNKTELVVIVTAYTVKPVDGGQLQTPLANLRPASDVEYVASRRAGADPLAVGTPRLVGPAGFVY